MPFLGLRCVYSVLYTFDHKDAKLNPITGALWIKVVFVVLAPLGAVIGMSIAGWLSREVAAAASFDQWGGSENGAGKEVGGKGSHQNQTISVSDASEKGEAE